MNLAVMVVTALSGGLGSVMRYLVDGQISGRLGTSYPWATTIINATGSLFLGILTGIASRGELDIPFIDALSLGLMGGYTTFSTASMETVRLLLAGRFGPAISNAFGSLGLAILLAIFGILLGTLI